MDTEALPYFRLMMEEFLQTKQGQAILSKLQEKLNHGLDFKVETLTLEVVKP